MESGPQSLQGTDYTLRMTWLSRSVVKFTNSQTQIRFVSRFSIVLSGTNGNGQKMREMIRSGRLKSIKM
jgi:hypothetical protein